MRSLYRLCRSGAANSAGTVGLAGRIVTLVVDAALGTFTISTTSNMSTVQSLGRETAGAPEAEGAR
jgi:hypothetical protein